MPYGNSLRQCKNMLFIGMNINTLYRKQEIGIEILGMNLFHETPALFQMANLFSSPINLTK